jgi:hypothetical protein
MVKCIKSLAKIPFHALNFRLLRERQSQANAIIVKNFESVAFCSGNEVNDITRHSFQMSFMIGKRNTRKKATSPNSSVLVYCPDSPALLCEHSTFSLRRALESCERLQLTHFAGMTKPPPDRRRILNEAISLIFSRHYRRLCKRNYLRIVFYIIIKSNNRRMEFSTSICGFFGITEPTLARGWGRTKREAEIFISFPPSSRGMMF